MPEIVPYNYETTRQVASTVFPGVTFTLIKMTEGRRRDLRKLLAEPNKKLRQNSRDQQNLLKAPDDSRDDIAIVELQEAFEVIIDDEINPMYLKWGVSRIDGLKKGDRELSLDDWLDWPRALTEEVLAAVRSETELNGAERKNLPSPTTSGAQGLSLLKDSTAPRASGEDSGSSRIADSTTPII